jgi:dihydroflavonol-4-reductase
MAPSDDTILVSGGTGKIHPPQSLGSNEHSLTDRLAIPPGFVGSHCILQAIQSGYTVHTTVRSLKRAEDVKQSLRNGGATAEQIEKVHYYEADLTKDGGWEEACAGCKYVLHVASPIPSGPDKPKGEEEDLVTPAVDGTLRVLRAAKQAGTVKRIVLTGSIAAINEGQEATPGKVFNEEDWTQLENPKFPTNEYHKSKTIAERAAWDFIEKDGAGIELVVVNPSAILGPVLSSDVATSLKLPMMLMNGKLPVLPNVSLSIVDVRDVADLELRAMTDPRAAGQRFIATSDEPTVSMKDIAHILKDNLPAAETKKVSTRGVPDFVIKLAGYIDPTAAMIVPTLSKPRPLTNAKAKRVLDWQPRTTKEAVLSSVESLKKYGLIKS